jgi:hypothetical protein
LRQRKFVSTVRENKEKRRLHVDPTRNRGSLFGVGVMPAVVRLKHHEHKEQHSLQHLDSGTQGDGSGDAPKLSALRTTVQTLLAGFEAFHEELDVKFDYLEEVQPENSGHHGNANDNSVTPHCLSKQSG